MSKPTTGARRNERWQNVGQAGDVCFVTTTSEGFRPALAPEPMARMFLDALQFYRSRGDSATRVGVMPEHVHLLLTPVRGSISDPLQGDQAVLDKIAYIHGNPVRRGCVRPWRIGPGRARGLLRGYFLSEVCKLDSALVC